MRIILILMAVMAVAAIASGAAPSKAEYVEFDPAKIAVTLKSPTCLQDTPSDEDEAIVCFAKDTELTITGRIDEKVKIDGEESYWYKVDLGDGADYYVFGAYLDF
ncbi:MAG: SH3 domain-containing protein [bacterium]|nr:SH3 domain-containing protein [bacterium]